MILKVDFIGVESGSHYDANHPIWQGKNGELLDLDFEARFPLQHIALRKPGMWRYAEAIPVEADLERISFDEGFTPMLPFDIGGQKIWVKQEQLFPSGSYKDRGASVLITKAKQLGIRKVVQDSSGNAGCAIAAYAALAGIDCEIFVPASTSPAKTKQISAYGAALTQVNGTREDTATAALEAAQQTYYASHCYNPFFLHGTKTLAFEICEQLQWKIPDAVVLPVGNGTLVLGAFIGFNELYRAGVTNGIPAIYGIQAANCAPLFSAWNAQTSFVQSPTVAEGIAIAKPVRAKQILQAIKETNGAVFTVSEAELLEAHVEVLKKGFYIEPTSASAIAGVKKVLASRNHTTIVTVFTGHGLKK